MEIRYHRRNSGRWKYELDHQVTHLTRGLPLRRKACHYPADMEFLAIDEYGRMTIRAGYAWDGASGPAINTETFRCGSLIHDALYQLIREGALPQSFRKQADQILREICIEDGMWRVRAWWVYRAVRVFGGKAARPNA